LNKDEIPSIDNTWNLLCKSECNKAILVGINKFKVLINERLIRAINQQINNNNSTKSNLYDNKDNSIVEIKQINNISEIYLNFYLIKQNELNEVINACKKEVYTNFTKDLIGTGDSINIYIEEFKKLTKIEVAKIKQNYDDSTENYYNDLIIKKNEMANNTFIKDNYNDSEDNINNYLDVIRNEIQVRLIHV